MGIKSTYKALAGVVLAQRDDGDVIDFHSFANNVASNRWYQDPLLYSTERQGNGTAVDLRARFVAPFTETFTFYVAADNSATATVDGVALGATKALIQGRSYEIALAYLNAAGAAGNNPALLKVEWQSASQARQLVPLLSPRSEHPFGKFLSSPYKAHLASGSTSRALLWKITRRDGRVFAYTPHDRDIIGNSILQDGVTPLECVDVVFKARNGIAPTGIANSSSLSADNMEVKAIFDDAEISEEEIEAGFFDDAEVWLAECSWRDLTLGIMRHKRGNIGELRWGQGMFEAETKARSSKLDQNIIELTSLECRCEHLGDARCGINLSGTTLDGHNITQTGTILAVDSAQPRRKFTIGSGSVLDTPDSYFSHGKLRITTNGVRNKDLWCKVRINEGNVIELADLLPYPMVAGQTFEIIMGCDRTIGTCAARYGNALRFQGEPYSPGVALYNSG